MCGLVLACRWFWCLISFCISSGVDAAVSTSSTVQSDDACKQQGSVHSASEGEVLSHLQKGHALHKRYTARESDIDSDMSSSDSAAATLIRPPEVPHNGFRVLQPVDKELQDCPRNTHLDSSSNVSLIHSEETPAADQRRKSFICSAGCSAREPQLELSLSPWADWPANYSGLEMLKTLLGFCDMRSPDPVITDPFIITVLWKDGVYVKACKDLKVSDPTLYLIGPEDLSLVITFLLGLQQVAALPPGPIAFGMHLGDYTSLADRHLTGPGLPLFAYLGRDTSWAIPWPSSLTVLSTYDVEQLQSKGKIHKYGKSGKASVGARGQASDQGPVEQKSWELREPKAYWIGQVTGPVGLQADAGLLALPRLKLLRLSHDNPHEVKAEWSLSRLSEEWWIQNKTNVSGFDTQRSRRVQEITGIPFSDYKPVDDWTNYKYYVNLDGTVLGGRLNKLMALGGVVLQHQAGYIEHMDALVKPYVHYVPVSYDLSDLVAKVEWLRNNDAEAKRIAASARTVANQRMRLEDHICYIWRALEALGAKIAAADSDESAVRELLTERGFKHATMKAGGMRPTLESFWGAELEDVHTGYIPHYISRLQWVWDRFKKLGPL